MQSKSRPKTTKGKTKEKSGGDGIGEKLAKAEKDIEVMKKEMEFRDDIIRRLRIQNRELRERISFLELSVEHKDQDRMDVTSDLNRQYQFMQSEMSQKFHQYETSISELKDKIHQKDRLLAENEEEYQQSLKEKDNRIKELDDKIEYLSQEFESMLHETLEKMAKKLEAISHKWKEEVSMTDQNRRRLEIDFNVRGYQQYSQ